MIAALSFGLVIGLLLGLLGGGGSILAVPALIYGVGQAPSSAIPTSLLVVGISSAAAVASRLRSGDVQWRIAGVFGTVGAAAAFGGTALNRLLNPRLVLVGFAVLMVAVGVQMLRAQTTIGDSCALPDGKINWRSCLPKAIASGAVVGFLTGLFGVGGGFLIIPALVVLLGLPMETAVATSLVIIVINSAAGFAAHSSGKHLDYGIAAAFTISAVLGSLAATRLSDHVNADRLRRWFAYLVFAVAAFVVTQVVLNPAALGG